MSAGPSRDLLSGLKALAGLDGCEITAEPEFMPKLDSWLLRLRLSIENPSEHVPPATAWAVIVDAAYPLGPITIYPAEQGGIVATFPHQERNMPAKSGIPWRSGKICAESVDRDVGVRFERHDPIGEPESRLVWYVARVLKWLSAAATGELVRVGDPFEIPQYVSEGDLTIIHDEGPDVYHVWEARAEKSGYCDFETVIYQANTLAVVDFTTFGRVTVRETRWSSVDRAIRGDAERQMGVWWRWPGPIVLKPWQTPVTWGELRQAGREAGIDIDADLSKIMQHVQGKKCEVLLLGCPIPLRKGDIPSEIHWQAVEIPVVSREGRQRHGLGNAYKGNVESGTLFPDETEIRYIKTENWHPDRLQARGRLHHSLRSLNTIFVGVGALGSAIAELMVRGGTGRATLFDADTLEAGNIVRHALTLKEIGLRKAPALTAALRLVNPYLRIEGVRSRFPMTTDGVRNLLDPFDLIIDCTGSDEVVAAMGLPWWPVPKLFCSASLGLFGKRLFLFVSDGNQFQAGHMREAVASWADSEREAWASEEETLEGAGCWSPLFPARFDDITMAASATVKVIEQASGARRIGSELFVYEQTADNGIFAGFKRVGS
jgi:hypothetical protein